MDVYRRCKPAYAKIVCQNGRYLMVIYNPCERKQMKFDRRNMGNRFHFRKLIVVSHDQKIAIFHSVASISKCRSYILYRSQRETTNLKIRLITAFFSVWQVGNSTHNDCCLRS